MENLAQLIKNRPDILPILKKGEIIEVKLIEKTPKKAFFEIARVGTGVVYGRELLNGREVIKGMEIGDTVSAKVVDPENEKGLIELSLTEADKQKAWGLAKDIQDKDEPVKVKVFGANSGGLLVELFDLKGFLPVSQLSVEHYPRVPEQTRERIIEELSKLVGQEFEVKVLSINPRTNKLILSEKEVMSQNIKDIINQYKIGDMVTGIISGLANFGAFIRFADNPEIEGLIHISELGHKLIDSPKEVVSVGDMVKAQVIDVKDNKISLSLKALQPDPWKDVLSQYKVNDTVKGTVYKFNPFGAFIKLNEDIVGLIHISEFGSPEEMKTKLTVGEQRDFHIEAIKPEEKRIILKLAK
ncbi:MAG: S1 RNA-binding domain-containing protein [Candidatus Colwellbacteria bacterium]|nr:S1 RNA-binding domain-containing protein [Candidatus Colwellbacteria bacterium]